MGTQNQPFDLAQGKPPQPEQPIQPLVPPTPEPTVQKNWYKYGFWGIAVFVVLSLLFVGVYFVFPRISGTKQVITNQETTPASPTPDVMAQWKTYSNDIYSFKYPQDWDTTLVGELPSHALMVGPQDKVADVAKLQGGYGGGKFLIMTVDYRNEAPQMKSDESILFTSAPFQVGSLNGTKYTVNALQDLPGLNKGDVTTTIVVKTGDVYAIIELLDNQYSSTFDSILSTFQFKTNAQQKGSQCNTSVDCPDSSQCENGYCMVENAIDPPPNQQSNQCTTSSDCPAGATCQNGYCIGVDYTQ